MEVDIVKEDSEFWNRLVQKSYHGSVFHVWEWLKIAEKHTNTKLYPLVGFKGTEPVALLPLFYKKKLGIRMVFSPPPYVAIPYLGPVIVDYNNLKEDKRLSILSSFMKVVEQFVNEELNAGYRFTIMAPNFLDCRPFKWLNYEITPMFHYLIDLSEGENYVWSQIKRKLRCDVERTKKRGVYVEEGNEKDLRCVYDLLVQRYKQQELPVTVPIDYLLDIYKNFNPENLRIFVAKYNGETISGIVTLTFKDKIIFWIGAPKKNFMGTTPNDLLQWEAIRWACRMGYRFYEEIGAGTERLAIFKAKYNPTLCVSFAAKKYNLSTKIIEGMYLRLRRFGVRL